MGANPRTKGQTGERQVMAIFNDVVDAVRRERDLPEFEQIDKPFQRNQNQSAVGGDDLTNPYGLSIEVKNQASLSVGAWWKQCLASADRPAGGIPIVVYKISRKGWHVIMEPEAWYKSFPDETHHAYPCEEKMQGTSRLHGVCKFRQNLLELWFRKHYERYLDLGDAI